MDPEANMREQLKLATSIQGTLEAAPLDWSEMEHTAMCNVMHDAARLSELVLAMRERRDNTPLAIKSR